MAGAVSFDAVRSALQKNAQTIEAQSKKLGTDSIMSTLLAEYQKANGGAEMPANRQLILQNTINHQITNWVRGRVVKDASEVAELFQAHKAGQGTGKMIKSTTVAENPGAVDNPISMLFNLLTVLVPNFAYMEAAAVQPMPTEESPIYYPQLTANTQANGVNVGDSLLGTTLWNQNNWYTSNRYKAFKVTTTTGSPTATATLQPVGGVTGVPLLPGTLTLTLTVPGTPPVVTQTTDDGNGHIVAVAGVITSGTINYATGALSVTLTSNAVANETLYADFRYNLDTQNPVQALFEFASKPVVAQPRRIRSVYNLDNFYAAKKVLQGYNLDEVMSSSLAGYINKEISGGVFENMLAAATLDYTWDHTLPTGVAWAWHRLSILDPVTQARNGIRQATARHGGNVWTVGNDLINTIETLGNDLWVPKKYDREPIGPYVAGELAGKIKVIKNQDFPADQSVMNFKADDTDASYAVGVFIGLYATDPLALDNLKVVQGLGTKIGEVQVFPNSLASIQWV